MTVSQRKKVLKLLLLSVSLVLLMPGRAQAYIGPGAGFAAAASLFAMFTAMLSAVVALLTWPLRYLIRAIRGGKAFARSRVKKVVILGLDGMDYSLTQRFLADGKLPNLDKLRRKGCFKRLTTTIPPISPVAWSSFQTGVNPGKHNIFDFLTRDKKNYLPRLSSVDIRGARRKIRLGKYQLPIGKPDIRLLRKSKPFWAVLGRHGIFSSVLRVPVTFPPEKFHGVQLSGMCVPDLRGTQGTFSYYTTRNGGESELTAGESFVVTRSNDTIKAELIGPVNPLQRDPSALKCPFVVTITDDSTARLAINGGSYVLRKDVYTEWIKVHFKAAPGMKVQGICRFLLLSTTPEFRLYVTPINIDPEKPAMSVSHPAIYSTYLAKSQGPFATLGLSEDSWALNEKIISEDSFIQQSVDTDAERRKMFFDSLDKIKRGLCICVFDGMDRIQHTFWRDNDEQGPADKNDKTSAIESLYQRMDGLVGEVLDKTKAKDTMLMIVSDHGFNAFRYGVDLNRWLEENGYLKLKQDGRGRKNLTGIDWSQTRAFAVGLAGIFLNLDGREAQGIVNPADQARSLREKIAAGLTTMTDTLRNGQTVIKQVYNSQQIYRGPYKDNAPDLIVGYNRGYRASWETAVGQVTDKVLHENTKAWSGDHCIDRSLVPGVLFCNREIATENPRLMDIGPTVLEMFGVSVPAYMDGAPLAVADGDNSGKGKKNNVKEVSR
jgi:predicted AlkP superfamily phosphohydrolase/phosphomutase